MFLNISVVITAINQADTIVESTESVLSQTCLPDRLGLALGPSRDGTERMAEFYEDEYDFIHFDRKPDTARRGFTHLRLDVLGELDTTFVLFLRGDTYLKRTALEHVGTRTNISPILGGVKYITPGGQSWSRTSPAGPSLKALLEYGPPVQGSIVWPRQALVENFPRLRVLDLGPFTTLGWLVILLDQGLPLESLHDTMIEAWDDREGEYRWTLRTVESMLALESLLETLEVPDGLMRRFKVTVDRILDEGVYPIEQGRSIRSGREFPWADTNVPLHE